MVVYEIRCEVDGRFYIGATINYHKRHLEHLNDLRKQRHHNQFLQRAFNKYGEDSFSFHILKEFSSEDEMWKYEERLVEERTNIYNAMPGGVRGPRMYGPDNPKYGRPISDQQRKLQSEAMSGENHPFWGKKRPSHSEFMKANNPMHTHNVDMSGAKNPNAKYIDRMDEIANFRKEGLTWPQIADRIGAKSSESLRVSFKRFGTK